MHKNTNKKNGVKRPQIKNTNKKLKHSHTQNIKHKAFTYYI